MEATQMKHELLSRIENSVSVVPDMEEAGSYLAGWNDALELVSEWIDGIEVE